MKSLRRFSEAGLFALAVTAIGLISRTTSAQEDAPGRKLAFLVGVKKYDHAGLPDLDFPENDVTELAEVLKSQNFEVVVLTTALAKSDPTLVPTAEFIRARLTQLLERNPVTKRDLIVVGLAGHGIQPQGSKEAYFCPRDANPTIEGDKPQKPKTLVALGEILKQLDDSGIGYKLLMVDACRNDSHVRGHRGVERVDVSALPPQTGVLLSCAPGEFSFEHKSLGSGHGVFFYHVIQGLKGGAKDAEDSDISWDSLRTYVKKKVPATVKKLFGIDGGEQRPNDIGNLIGEPMVLAIAPLGTQLKPKPEPVKPTPKLEEPAPEATGTFAGSTAGQLRDVNGLKLVWIPPGYFTMGSPKDEKDRREDENQVHVTLTMGFWMGQHEVTQSEWRRVTQTTPWRGKDYVKEGEDYPATYVSWDDAIQFCTRLTESERRAGRLPSDWEYTLPTEAQWENACRAGTTTRYWFGNDDSDLSDYAWWGGIAGDGNAKSDQYAHAVGQKRANPWGLIDMHGNVWEWCSDYYANTLAGGTDPRGPSEGSYRVIRGGSWGNTAWNCRSAYRSEIFPRGRSSNLGCRLTAVPSSTVARITVPPSRPAEPMPEPQMPPSAPGKKPELLVAPFGAEEARAARKAWAQYQRLEEEQKNSIGLKLTLIPAGEFQMGSTPAEVDKVVRFDSSFKKQYADDEQPRHRVRITRPFYLGTYEVTKGEFRKFVDDAGYKTQAEMDGKGSVGYTGKKDSSFPFAQRPSFTWRDWGVDEGDESPVVNVSHNDAMAFCEWLSKKEGKKYRLPTEAEWEYACRAGTTSLYYNGDDPESLTRIGNVADATAKKMFPKSTTVASSNGWALTAPAGQFAPNSFDVNDMTGNVWEWCSDWYNAKYYGNSPASDPTGPPSGSRRVDRGGSWFGTAGYCRSARRSWSSPVNRFFNLGFRVALSASVKQPKIKP